jgi:hypothetical protein
VSTCTNVSTERESDAFLLARTACTNHDLYVKRTHPPHKPALTDELLLTSPGQGLQTRAKRTALQQLRARSFLSQVLTPLNSARDVISGGGTRGSVLRCDRVHGERAASAARDVEEGCVAEGGREEEPLCARPGTPQRGGARG